jgi:preprotein translocase subunit SecD
MCGAYRLVAEDGSTDASTLVSATRAVLIARLAALGVADPRVEVRDEGSVIVEALAEEPLLREVIGARGQVAFVPVPPDLDQWVADGRPAPRELAAIEPLFTSDGLEEVHAVIDDLGMPSIEIRLNADAARVFDEHAAEHLGERFAIVVDGVIVSAPSINAAEFGGEVRISGAMEAEEALALVAVLGSDALPARLAEVRLGPCPDAG